MSLYRKVGAKSPIQAIYRLWIGDGVEEPESRDLALLLAYARVGSIAELAHERGLAVSTVRNLLHHVYTRLGAIGAIDAVFKIWGPVPGPAADGETGSGRPSGP